MKLGFCAIGLACALQVAFKGENPGEELSFSLRHVLHHGALRYPGLLRRADVDFQLWADETLRVKRVNGHVRRLEDRKKESIENYFTVNEIHQQSLAVDWTLDPVSLPNVTDKATVITLAEIAKNAYVKTPRTEDWYDLLPLPFNSTGDFGWENDGLRGHIFVDETNSTVILGLKGTSAIIFDGGSGTSANDKTNDNLLFSCCCGRVSYLWNTVCDCYSGTYSCNQTCLKSNLHRRDRYYYAARQLYYNVSHMYPNSNIWAVGHSLGGAISSLIGLTYGLPTVTFEAPGELLAAERLNLPLYPKLTASESGIFHFGHTADPVYMGVCNGPGSVCWISGYAMETTCKVGLECTYDTVNDKGWRVSISTHRINNVIRDVLQKYDRVPLCKAQTACVDCFSWKFHS